MLHEVQFNLGILISLMIAAALVLALTIFEFTVFLLTNKYLIFKKVKFFNIGFIVNTIVLVISLVISILLTFPILLTFLEISQLAYFPCMLVWWTVTCLAIAILITRTVITIKSWKHKYEIKDALHLSIDQLTNQFKIKNFKESTINFKYSKNDKWYENIQTDFNEISHKIETLNSSGVGFVATEIITFLEAHATTISNKRNKYAYCLFLILLDNLQKKINPDKINNITEKNRKN